MARLTLLLALGPAQPLGDLDDRLTLQAPLTPQAWLDPGAAGEGGSTAWPGARTLPDGRVIACRLVRAGAGWALQRQGPGDHPLWAFEARVLRPGEYATLRDPAGAEFVYRVVNVERV